MIKISKWPAVLFLTLFITLSFAQEKEPNKRYTEKERQVILKFKETIDKTRDRIDRQQKVSELSEIHYMDAEKVIRDAGQLEDLIDDGHYVDIAKIRDMQTKLRNLGEEEKYDDAAREPYKNWDNKDNPEAVFKSGEDVIRRCRAKISSARERLDDQHKAGEITEAEYDERLARITQAEKRVHELEQDLNQVKKDIAALKEDTNLD